MGYKEEKSEMNKEIAHKIGGMLAKMADGNYPEGGTDLEYAAICGFLGLPIGSKWAVAEEAIIGYLNGTALER